MPPEIPEDLDDADGPAPAEAVKPPPIVHAETVTAYNQDGSAIDLPPAAAQAAFSAGKVGFGQAAKVAVRLADGRVGSVPGGQLAGALSKGAQLISPADKRQDELEKQYGGALGTAEATGLGALRGATLGASDYALSSPGFDETANFLKKRHDIASGIGEAAGVVGLGALTGGGSLAEEGGALAAKEAATGGAGLLGRLAPHAIKGALEGAAIGHTEAVSEDALSGGDHQLTAEKYFSTVAENALFGGALGAGGALLGEGAGVVKNKVASLLSRTPSAENIEKVAAQQFGFVPEGLGKALVKAQSALAGGGEDIIREAGVQNMSPEAKALRSTLLNIDGERDAAARTVTGHVNTLLQDGRDLADEAKGSIKRDHLGDSVRKDNLDEIATHSRATIDSTKAQIQTMIANSEDFGQEKLLRRMESEIGRFQGKIATAAEQGNNAEQFALIDDTKRAIGSWTRDVKATSLRTSTDPIALRQSRATYDELDKLYEGLRSNLEDEATWGKAGADQRRINEAWTSQIAADKQFRSTLAAQVGEERFGGKVYAADPAKVARYVGSLTNPDQDLVHQTIANYVKSTKNFVDAVGSSYELDAGQAAKVARAKAAADAFDTTLGDIGQKLAKANQLKSLLGGEGGGGLTGFALGSLAGGPVGGAVGSMVQQLANPGRNILRLAQLESVMGRVDQKIAGGVSGFFERSAARAGGALKTSVKTGGRVARGTATAERQTTREAYERAAGAVKKVATNPTMLTDRVAPHVAPIQGAAPKTTAAVGAVAAKAAGYLASKLPTPPAADVMTGKPGIPPASEQQRFTTITQTVLHPEGAIADFAKGRITKDQVDALQAVYPQLYGQMRSKVQAALLDHTSAGKALDYPARVQLATLFGIEGDPSMAPDAMKHAQTTFATPPTRAQGAQGGGPKGSGKPLRVANETASFADQVASGGGG